MTVSVYLIVNTDLFSTCPLRCISFPVKIFLFTFVPFLFEYFSPPPTIPSSSFLTSSSRFEKIKREFPFEETRNSWSVAR